MDEDEQVPGTVSHEIQNRKSNRLSKSNKNSLNTSSSDEGKNTAGSPTSNDSRFMKRSDSYKDLTADTLSPKG